MRRTKLDPSPIALRLEELRSRREGALVAYLTGGDPTPDKFLENCSALLEGGADILEIGIPFSDPIADGPVIQAACQRALQAGITPKKVLGLAGELSRQYDLPLILLTYYNPILAMGCGRFLNAARNSGVSGVVVPDNPIGADPQFDDLARDQGIDRILLAAPNTPRDRLVQSIAKTAGFLYLVSIYGVTGQRDKLGPSIDGTLRRIHSVNKAKVPVLVGFGVSSPDQVKTLISKGADGAIVGSALVQITRDHVDDAQATERALKRHIYEMKNATRKN